MKEDCCLCLKGSWLFHSGSVEQEWLISWAALTSTLKMKPNTLFKNWKNSKPMYILCIPYSFLLLLYIFFPERIEKATRTLMPKNLCSCSIKFTQWTNYMSRNAKAKEKSTTVRLLFSVCVIILFSNTIT